MIENGIHNWMCPLYREMEDVEMYDFLLKYMVKYSSITKQLSSNSIYDKIKDYDYFSDDGFHDFTDSLPLFNSRDRIEELLNCDEENYSKDSFMKLKYDECYVYSTLFGEISKRIG